MTSLLVRVGIGSIDGDGTSKSGEPNAIGYAINYFCSAPRTNSDDTKQSFSRSHDAVIRVYDEARDRNERA